MLSHFEGRLPALLVVGTATVMMAVALYMEHVMGLEPCPLCMMQRIWVCIAGLIGLGAALHGPRSHGARTAWAGGIAVAAGIGGFFSGKQLWLQSLPADEVPACGPPLDYMFEVFPLVDVLIAMTQGTGDCAEVQWSFLGLSIPAWTLLGFLFFIDLALLWWVASRRSTAAAATGQPGGASVT